MQEQSNSNTTTQVRRSKSSLLYLRMLDARGIIPGCNHNCSGACASCIGEWIFGPPVTYGTRMNEPAYRKLGQVHRDRRYGMPKRYGMKTSVTTRRVDRIDPVRSLY